MTDSWNLGAMGSEALAEGIKFLYAQAGEALKSWRERRSHARFQGEANESAGVPVEVILPTDVFTGELVGVRLDLREISRLEDKLKELRHALMDYIDGVADVDPADSQLWAVIDELRHSMEAIYGQKITFRGESAVSSGAQVTGHVKADSVSGYAAGMRSRHLVSGSVKGDVESATVEPSGEVVGVDIEEIG